MTEQIQIATKVFISYSWDSEDHKKVELLKGKIVERVSCATLAYSLIPVKVLRY
ncbi:hypothetical protein [Nostoc sp.]|uniref:hypothetical protein n=1 Tax=Nostoc sp. TaxID=1180 RepID=UPI002FFB57B5